MRLAWLLTCLFLCGCGVGKEFLVKDRTYDQIWAASEKELQEKNRGFFGGYQVRSDREAGELVGGGSEILDQSLTIVDLRQRSEGIELLVRVRRYRSPGESPSCCLVMGVPFFRSDLEEAEKILQAILHRLGISEGSAAP